MFVTLLKDVNFGSAYTNLTGVAGVSYQVLDVNGNVVTGPVTTGVYEVVTGSGIYAANITFSGSFNGQVVWSAPATGSMPVAYATEEYNPKTADVFDMVSSITGSVKSLVDVGFGNWAIVGTQMLFYASGSATVIATYNLLDSSGNPTNDAVFQRVKV